MTDDEQTSLADLDAAIDAARRDYATQRDKLEGRLGAHVVDASDVADRLLSVADEFGREHALELMAERPDDYGVREQASSWRDAADLNEDLERLIDTQERLDDLTQKREKLAQRGDGKPVRIVNIQGQAYEFDAAKRELREVASGERHAVSLEEIGAGRPLTLTQQAARDAQAPKAQPRGDRDRTRER